MEEQEDTTIYKVVVNHEEQYSIWPSGKENPLGWRDAGRTGLKSDCLAYIKNLWSDIRRLSFKKQIDQVSGGVNDFQGDCPRDACIHHLFEKQVDRVPDATAVVFADKQLTYAELNCKANQLAHYLQKIGLNEGEKVGLCVERSLDIAVGLLGILKAGGAFVPLDPMYPNDRLDFMMRESQVQLLLTQERPFKKLPEHCAQVICLDRDWPLISKENGGNVNSAVSAASLAYVIYTSGSTGMPKGVMVAHVSLWHYVEDLPKALGIVSEDVYLHTATISFSSSVRQLMMPLAKGATVAIATTEQRTNPLALLDMIKRRNVTIMDTVPTFWQSCCDALTGLEQRSREELLDNKLRLILTTGEPLSYRIVNKWRFDFKHPAHLINMYGATETSGSIALYPIVDKDTKQTKLVPLGRPVPNAQIYLLNEDLKPVSKGISGELYLAGPRAALGYLNRSGLTAETFIPDPFSKKPGARMCKTGDLAHYLPDGNFGFIGRIDYQINIRGMRIEPGEIESVLSDHPAIGKAVVVGRDSRYGEKLLVGYLTCDPESKPSVSNLRNYLQGRIPDHMIPASFVVLNTMPLTSSGKIDRKALPALDATRPDLENPFIPPRTPVEETLVGIWSKIFGIDQVGIHDKFLELGGTSLMGTRVVYHIRAIYRLELSVRHIFENPTIAELAVVITQRSVEQNQPKDIDNILSELEMLSDEEAQQIFSEKEGTIWRR